MNPLRGRYLAAYRRNQALWATPVEELAALYSGSVRIAREARKAVADREHKRKAERIDCLLTILGELEGALRPEAAPELCQDLQRLYRHMRQRLLEGASSGDVAAFDEVILLLDELAQAWKEVAELDRKQRREKRST